jgi:hypothetical protein
MVNRMQRKIMKIEKVLWERSVISFNSLFNLHVSRKLRDDVLAAYKRI